MNIILSLWTKPCTNGKAHGFTTVQDMINSLILAVNVAKRNYENIHFYTDKLGMEWVAPHLSDLPFTKIEVCLDEINWLDERYWSLVKVYVYSLQKEPFIHIDNDVYLWDRLPDELIHNDFVFQEIENFNSFGMNYHSAIEIYKDEIPKNIKIFGAAFNCGLCGCTNIESLGLFKDLYNLGKEFINNIFKSKTPIRETGDRSWLGAVLLEQLFVYSLVVESKKKYAVFLNQDPRQDCIQKRTKTKYTHLLGHNKRNEIVMEKIRERVKFKDWNA